MIKVVHCGDMHLDSPFTSANKTGEREERKNELLADFSNMINFCREKNVDIILLAGDLFDNPFPSQSCIAEVIRAFENFDGRVFISPGNHDPFVKGSVYEKTTFPENVTIFNKNEIHGEHFEIRGCKIAVYGCAFTSYYNEKNPLAPISLTSGEELNLVSVHGDIYATDSVYAPIDRESIADLSPHYLALAHVHKRSDITVTNNTAYAYSGSLSSRDFGETGRKGCYYLEFDEKIPAPPVKHEFIPIGKRRHEILVLRASTKTTSEDLIESLFPGLLTKDCCLRLVLKGECSDSKKLISELEKGLGARIGALEVQDETEEPINYEELENDPSALGEFYRMLKPQLHTEEARLALRLGLAAIKGEDPSEKIQSIFNGEL